MSARVLFPATCLLGALALACDGTAPSPRTRIALEFDGTPSQNVYDGPDGYPRIECNATLAATASGEGSAVWQDGMLRWYWGTSAERATPVDSQLVPKADIRYAWGDSVIRPGATQRMVWDVWSSLPSTIEFEYTVRDSSTGIVSRVSKRLDCGSSPEEGEAPPTLAPLQIVDVDGAPLESGDILRLTYDAASQAGIWFVEVRATGAFDTTFRVNESLATSRRRSVDIVVPYGAAISAPAVVQVQVVDAFNQSATQAVQSAPLADATPPELILWQVDRTYGTHKPLGGSYFVGETIELDPVLFDNHEVKALVWDVLPAGHRDSVIVNGPILAGQILRIPVRNEWLGGIQIRFFGRDASGLLSDTVTGAYTILPTLPPPVITSVQGEVRSYVVSQARNSVYLLHGNQRFISELSLTTRTVTRTVSLPSVPLSGDVTPSGDSLLVVMAARRSLAVIDLRQDVPVPAYDSLATLDPAAGEFPQVLRIADNGRAFITVAGNTPASARVLELELSSGAEQVRAEPGPAGGLARSGDHSMLVVRAPGCVQRYTAASNTFSACTTGLPNAGPAVNEDGSLLAFLLDVHDGSFNFVRRMESPYDLTNTFTAHTISPDGSYVFHFIGTGMLRSRVADGALMDRVSLPTDFFVDHMFVTPDGSTLVGVNSQLAVTPSRLAFVDLVTSPVAVRMATRPSLSAPRPVKAPEIRMESPPLRRGWRTGRATP